MKKVLFFTSLIIFLASCSIPVSIEPIYEPFDNPANGNLTAIVGGKNFKSAENGGLSIQFVGDMILLYAQNEEGGGFMFHFSAEEIIPNKIYDLNMNNEDLMIRYYPPSSNNLRDNIAAITGYISISGKIKFSKFDVRQEKFMGTFEFVGQNQVENKDLVKTYEVTNGNFEIYN